MRFRDYIKTDSETEMQPKMPQPTNPNPKKEEELPGMPAKETSEKKNETVEENARRILDGKNQRWSVASSTYVMALRRHSKRLTPGQRAEIRKLIEDVCAALLEAAADPGTARFSPPKL